MRFFCFGQDIWKSQNRGNFPGRSTMSRIDPLRKTDRFFRSQESGATAGARRRRYGEAPARTGASASHSPATCRREFGSCSGTVKRSNNSSGEAAVRAEAHHTRPEQYLAAPSGSNQDSGASRWLRIYQKPHSLRKVIHPVAQPCWWRPGLCSAKSPGW